MGNQITVFEHKIKNGKVEIHNMTNTTFLLAVIAIVISVGMFAFVYIEL